MPADDPEPQAAELADWLKRFAVGQVERLARRHLPGWRIPGTFGGHLVEADVRADLLYTLGHLHAGRVQAVGDEPLEDAVRALLAGIDGAGTHTFFSYRVAETVRRWGPWDANPLIASLPQTARDEVARACDSTEWLPLLDEQVLPRNYAAVLARCELARLRLGLDVDQSVLEGLVSRVRETLGANPWLYLDDSNHGIGRFDIYTADVWLFTEPLAEHLGRLWQEGVQAALGLVESVISDDGTAVAWGRSTGSLGAALTVELGALAAAENLGDSPARWLARARRAASAMPSWFTDGVVDAHRHRSPYGYRGPFRRLQLTLDLLGKLAWAATRLGEHSGTPVRGDDHPTDTGDTEAAHTEERVAADMDRLIRFRPEDSASVWVHRRAGSGFVVPFVGASRSDYLPAPRAPGRFEVPVDSDIACWVPLAVTGTRRLCASGVPVEVTHSAGGVQARWDGLRADAELDPAPTDPLIRGDVRASWQAVGRGVRISWSLDLDRAPTALSYLVPERPDRPLRVEWAPGRHTTGQADTVLTEGISEWRSFWSELSTLHQFDVDPAPRSEVSFTVTPKLRVASSAFGHHYHRSLYGPLADRVVDLPSPWGPLGDPTVDPAGVDLFHLHWPEWLAFDDLRGHVAIVEELDRRGVGVAWTAHNLTPHDKRPEVYDPIYRLWAENADAVIHHSRSGLDRFVKRYGPGRGRHVVIPHGHFGGLWAPHRTSRERAAEALGLPDAALRIGLVGAPREEKLVGDFLEGVARSTRRDVQVLCWSLREGESAPEDPRIAVAEQYELVAEDRYALRLCACDLLALPFDPDGDMLATGTVSDAIGMGIPALTSRWQYLAEALGDAAIVVGHTAQDVAAAIDALDAETLAAATEAAAARRDALRWDDIAARTEVLFEQVLAERAAQRPVM